MHIFGREQFMTDFVNVLLCFFFCWSPHRAVYFVFIKSFAFIWTTATIDGRSAGLAFSQQAFIFIYAVEQTCRHFKNARSSPKKVIYIYV